METGKIVQILGPVIDVAFTGKLPMIKDALTVHHCFRVAFRSYDLAFWCGQGHCGFRGVDGVGIVRLFRCS